MVARPFSRNVLSVVSEILASSGLLPDTAGVTSGGHLTLAGCDVVDLAAEFGTPLYVYDEATIRNRARAYRDGLRLAYGAETLVCYAGKAYCAPWVLRLVAEEGLGLDVVSGGELFAAQASQFPADRTYFHGNNKGGDELAMALQAGVARIVVDNLEEIERLSKLASGMGKRQQVMLRVAPGVEAHTHAHIKTGVLDTKFGVSIQTGAAQAAAAVIHEAAGLELVGLHAHIGSQLFELEPYRATIDRVFELAARLRAAFGFELRELSPGGGFGMRYTAAEQPIPPAEVARGIAEAVCDAAQRSGLAASLPRLTIEPGRSIVGPAGVAVYTVGSVKDITGVRTYVAIDGGMADNIRPTTYGAVYTPLLANRVLEDADATVAVAGKYCESGDVLVKQARLPLPRVGDLVAVPGSGAYQLAMASNYNMSLRPAVVVVADGKARLVRRRETYADLLRPEV
ncbi:MAG: diaminopimelate decarboxylase [Chloroflexota bacterium]|nr:diaminopimelate decarboxylase [Chloroflexota bacterium]